ncbi:MAG: hypothetical protein WC227_00005, partial [Patescibacteria group bacterium]
MDLRQELNIASLDKEIHRIQRSTRTLWRHFRPLHNHLRMKFRWYYKWHLNPWAHALHWSALGLYLVGIAVFGYTFFQHPTETKAASQRSWATGEAWKEWKTKGLKDKDDKLILNSKKSEGTATLTFNPLEAEVVDWLSSETIATGSIKSEFSTDDVLWSTNIGDVSDSKSLYVRLTFNADEKNETELSSFALNYSRYPATPDGLTVVTRKSIFGSRHILEAGAFSDPDGDNHAASQWEVTNRAGDYTNPIIESGPRVDGNLLNFTLPINLAEGTYYFRVRYQDSVGAWSLWSKDCALNVVRENKNLVVTANSGIQPSQDENEVVGRRTEKSKTIDNKDGTETLESYPGVIHYKEDYSKSDSPWLDINSNHLVDSSEYVLFDQMPSTVKVFKDKIGYEIESRKTGDKYTISLKDIDGNPVLSKSRGSDNKVAWADINTPEQREAEDTRNALAKWISPQVLAEQASFDDGNLKFEFEIGEYGVRLWKTITGVDAPQNFKWQIDRVEGIKSSGGSDLVFRDKPEAFEIVDGKEDRQRQVKIDARKMSGDLTSAFTWQETAPQSDIKIDTDVTYRPDPDPETSSVDGYLSASGAGTWAAARDAVDATIIEDYTTAAWADFIMNYDNANFNTDRTIFTFDASPILGATVTSATFSAYGNGSNSNYNAADPDINLYSSAPASNTGLVASDYSTLGTTAYSDPIAYASFATAYNNFALNAAGLSGVQTEINANGMVRLGLRNANYDVADISPSTIPGEPHGGGVSIYMSEEPGTDFDPKLSITYAAAGSHISGIAYDNNIQSGVHLGAGVPISLSVNGGAKQTVTTNASGVFDFTATGLAADLPITIF